MVKLQISDFHIITIVWSYSLITNENSRQAVNIQKEQNIYRGKPILCSSNAFLVQLVYSSNIYSTSLYGLAQPVQPLDSQRSYRISDIDPTNEKG